jgi:predicted AAA+ superfamily ATPase
MARLVLYPLSLSEINKPARNIIDYLLAGDFSSEQVLLTDRKQLARYMLQGGYPEVQSKSGRAKRIWFDSYIEGRLFKDFESLHTARGDFHSKLRALVPYLAGLSGSLLKYVNVANDLELNDKLIKTYIEILELMFIVRRVPAYLNNPAKRQAARMPKLHFVDVGLACHLLGLRNEQQLMKHSLFGTLLESLMYMEFSKQACWAQDDVALYHFRDQRKNEVDIVMERPNSKILGLEIKAAASVDERDFRGLVKLAEYAGNKFEQGCLFYTGEQILPFQHKQHRLYALPLALVFGCNFS